MSRKPWADQGSAASRGYGAAWRKLRAQILARDKHLCQPCLIKGHVTPASEVHHKRAKADGGTDAPENLTSTCGPCHDALEAANRGHKQRRAIGLDGYPID